MNRTFKKLVEGNLVPCGLADLKPGDHFRMYEEGLSVVVPAPPFSPFWEMVSVVEGRVEFKPAPDAGVV